MNDRVAMGPQTDESCEFHQTGTAGVSRQQQWEWCKGAGICDLYPCSFQDSSGGSGWEWHVPTGQYYYHAFKDQPDLNWRRSKGHAAIDDSMRFWLDKGADGLRIGAMWHLIEDANLRDNRRVPDYAPDRDSP